MNAGEQKRSWSNLRCYWDWNKAPATLRSRLSAHAPALPLSFLGLLEMDGEAGKNKTPSDDSAFTISALKENPR